MSSQTHITVNTIVSFPLKYYLGWSWAMVLIFIVAGILIDVDHPLYLIFRCKTLSIKQWIKTGKELRKRMQPGLYIFHSPEFEIILLSLSFFSYIALTILLSNSIHLILDIFEHRRFHKNFSGLNKWSIIHALKNKFMPYKT